MLASAQEPRTPDRVVFIHGTFAARLSGEGSAWWQMGSMFSQFLREALHGLAIPTEEAFHWTGENSDSFRVFASAPLLERLCRENETGPFHVIAHSHGGTVLFQALMLAVERGVDLSNLRSWITVGTPFIFYEASIGRVARVHAVPTMIALIVSTSLVFQQTNSTARASLFAVGTIVALSLCFLYLAKASSKRLRDLEHETVRLFGSRWHGIRSQHDEAIALLKAALRLRTSILPRWVDEPRWSYSYAGATRIRGRVPRRVWRRRGPSKQDPAFYIHPNEWLLWRRVSSSGWRCHARGWILGVGLFWPINMVLSLTRSVYQNIVAERADRLVAEFAKSRLLGDDAPYFSAVSVTDVPSRGQDLSAVELPSEVDDALVRQANANATSMLSAVRRNYIAQLVMAPSSPILATLPEISPPPTTALVHCLYFEVASCRHLIAAVLRSACEDGFSARSRVGSADPER